VASSARVRSRRTLKATLKSRGPTTWVRSRNAPSSPSCARITRLVSTRGHHVLRHDGGASTWYEPPSTPDRLKERLGRATGPWAQGRTASSRLRAHPLRKVRDRGPGARQECQREQGGDREVGLHVRPPRSSALGSGAPGSPSCCRGAGSCNEILRPVLDVRTKALFPTCPWQPITPRQPNLEPLPLQRHLWFESGQTGRHHRRPDAAGSRRTSDGG
jgi:hypothetical protein